MSSDDLKQIEKLMIDLLANDNNVRGEAEKKLNQTKNNSSALVYCLAKLIYQSENNGVKTLSSVLLRKLITIKEEEDISPVWESLDNNYKESVKQDLINAVLKEKNKDMKIKICDTMVSVAENVFENKESWPVFFNFIKEGLTLDTNNTDNVSNIETVLFVLSQIFGYIYDYFKDIDSFIVTFKNFFNTNISDLKTRTSQVIGEILTVVNKKESKKFKDFIPLILEHTYKCLIDSKQEGNVRY